MRIDKEAVIDLIHKADTLQDIDRIAQVTHVVADIALRESADLLMCTAEYCDVTPAQYRLGERALEAL